VRTVDKTTKRAAFHLDITISDVDRFVANHLPGLEAIALLMVRWSQEP